MKKVDFFLLLLSSISPYVVRRAHHERGTYSARPEPVEGLILSDDALLIETLDLWSESLSKGVVRNRTIELPAFEEGRRHQ